MTESKKSSKFAESGDWISLHLRKNCTHDEQIKTVEIFHNNNFYAHLTSYLYMLKSYL